MATKSPELLILHGRRKVKDFISESQALCLVGNDNGQRRTGPAMRFWMEALVRNGHTGIPPFFAIDLVSSMAEGTNLTRLTDMNGPEDVKALRRRYVRALDDFWRLEKFRWVLEEGKSRPGFSDVIREMLNLVAELIEDRVKVLPAFSFEEMEECLADSGSWETHEGEWHYLSIWKEFVSAFETLASMWSKEELDRQAGGIEDELRLGDMEVIRLARSFISESPIAWDLLGISRVLELLNEPGRAGAGQRQLASMLPNLHVERVEVRSRLPSGGYVGLRQNGGEEDISSAAPSELAFPQLFLLEKAFNKRLNVFERPLRRVRVQRVKICLCVDFLETPPERLIPTWRESAAVLTCLLAEFVSLFGKQAEGEVELHLLLPWSSSLIRPSAVISETSRPGLPFFLDPLRSGNLAELFHTPLGAGREMRLSGARGDSFEHLLDLCSDADEAHAVRLGRFTNNQERARRSREWQKAFSESNQRNASLLEASFVGDDWNLSVEGRPEKVKLPSAELVRECVLRLLEQVYDLHAQRFATPV